NKKATRCARLFCWLPTSDYRRASRNERSFPMTLGGSFMIRRSRIAILISFQLLGLWPVSASALNGNEWKQINEGQRGSYIMGVVDTWANVVELVKLRKDHRATAAEQLIMNNVECAQKKMTYNQIFAIVDKY